MFKSFSARRVLYFISPIFLLGEGRGAQLKGSFCLPLNLEFNPSFPPDFQEAKNIHNEFHQYAMAKKKKTGLGSCCETTGSIWVSGANNSFDSTIRICKFKESATD